MLYRPGCARHLGFTLMEMVVVLVILVALAGLVIPMISSTFSQTRHSTTGANLAEVASMVSAYQCRFGRYPDYWDSLIVTGTSGSGGSLATYLPGNGTGVLSTYLTTATPTSINSAAPNPTAYSVTDVAVTLSNAGIANVFPFVSAPANPTFYPYGTAEYTSGTTGYVPPTPATITDSTTLAVLTSVGASTLNLPAGATAPTYVVFGLGSRNAMVPKTILDAPVLFTDSSAANPDNAYCRVAVVFQVTDTSGNPLPAAILAGTFAFSNEHGISTLGNQIQRYNNTMQVGQ